MKCAMCLNEWTEWLTRCGDWVCSDKCLNTHELACTWCAAVLKQENEKENK